MPSLSDLAPLGPEERASFGVARAKTLAFDAVHSLWRRRRAEGKSQADLAQALGKDEGWLSKNLRGPGNWTIKTLGELVEALNGDLEITVYGAEDPLPSRPNWHAYVGYELPEKIAPTSLTQQPPVSLTPGAVQIVSPTDWVSQAQSSFVAHTSSNQS